MNHQYCYVAVRILWPPKQINEQNKPTNLYLLTLFRLVEPNAASALGMGGADAACCLRALFKTGCAPMEMLHDQNGCIAEGGLLVLQCMAGLCQRSPCLVCVALLIASHCPSYPNPQSAGVAGTDPPGSALPSGWSLLLCKRLSLLCWLVALLVPDSPHIMKHAYYDMLLSACVNIVSVHDNLR